MVPSSGNVFADLGLPNAEGKQTKVRLAVVFNQIIKSPRLGQTVAARRLNVNQPRISEEPASDLTTCHGSNLKFACTSLNRNA